MDNIITKTHIEKTVTIKNGQEVVRSDNLAKMFDRTHKQVLALIRSNLDFFKENNLSLKDFFIEEKAKTVKGKEYLRYFLTRKGFDLIALSLRGDKAQLYKLWYIDAFHDTQQTLIENKLKVSMNKSNDLWVQFREEGKEFRNKLTKAIHDTVVVYRNDVEKKMNDGKYYYHYTQLIYSVLGVDVPTGVNPRDVLDKRQLVRLEDMEDKVASMITMYSDDLHYKDVYKKVKKELER